MRGGYLERIAGRSELEWMVVLIKNRATYMHASACDYFCLLIRMQNIGSVVLILSSPHFSLLSTRKAESRIIGLGDAPPIDTNMVRTSSLFRATLVATYATLNLHGSSLHF